MSTIVRRHQRGKRGREEESNPDDDEMNYLRCIRGLNVGERERGRAREWLLCSHLKPVIHYTACDGVCNPLQYVAVIAGTIQTNALPGSSQQ